MTVEAASSADELGPYRPLSGLAVMALVLGLCAPLGFASPLLLLVPLLGVGVAGLALLKIQAAAQHLSGASLAWAGLALALGFGVAAVARGQIRQVLYERQVDAVVRPWLQQLAAEAYVPALDSLSTAALAQLQATAATRSSLPFYPDRLLAQELSQDPSVQALVQLARPARIPELVTTTEVQMSVTPFPGASRANSTYQVTNSRDEVLWLSLELVRPTVPGQSAAWVIESWQRTSPAAPGELD